MNGAYEDPVSDDQLMEVDNYSDHKPPQKKTIEISDQ